MPEKKPKKLTPTQQANALKVEANRLAAEAAALLAKEVRVPGKTEGYSIPGDNGWGKHYEWEKADFGPGFPFVPSKIPGMTISYMEDGTEVYKVTINGVNFLVEIGQMNYVPHAVREFFENAAQDHKDAEELMETGINQEHPSWTMGTWHYEHGAAAWLDIDGLSVDTTRYNYIVNDAGIPIRVGDDDVIAKRSLTLSGEKLNG